MTRVPAEPGPIDPSTPEGAVRLLRSTDAVRERAAALLARARAGASDAFEVDDAALAACASAVASLTRERFPDLRIPYHSRWRHFEAGGVDRRARLDARLGAIDAAARARAHIDLALTSVLLDAGAGAVWSYLEADTGLTFSRSEGLGVASFHAFMGGLFSSDPAQPLQVDAVGLAAIDTARLGAAFQVSDANPLIGVAERAALLRRLGAALAAAPEVFGRPGRPGALFDVLVGTASGGTAMVPRVAAHDILVQLLERLSSVWPAHNTIGALPLGDVWPHPAVSGPGLTAGWMPFHKLSQWLSYSLLEPFEWAGVPVRGLEALTGLPEYRNGGLLIDTGVLRPRPNGWATRTWVTGDPFVVEWRALTVALLDELAPRVRGELGVGEDRLPLACVLEGGTWAAGRHTARQRRQGLPPLNIASDGTVF